MAIRRIVKVCKPVYPPDGFWRIYDKQKEHEETEVDPRDLHPDVQDIMRGRLEEFFYAVWSADGWIIKQWTKRRYHWVDDEGNPI